MNNKITGDDGENEICARVACPNCGKPLMTLPRNYPLYDIQCSGCMFRAQVKTNHSKPKNEIFGAGWDIMEKVLKAGFTIPPLFVNFRWEEKNMVVRQEIHFYPFIPKSHLKHRSLSQSARRANYKMFNYVNLDVLPHFVLYKG